MKNHHNINFSPKMLLILLTFVCGAFLSVSVLWKDIAAPFSNIVAAVIVPMQNGVNFIGVWADEHFSSIKSAKELREENKELSRQVEELAQANDRLHDESEELKELRKLLALDEEYSDYKKVGARVIGNGGGNWYNNFIINKGSEDGIQVDMNVLADTGLAGVVTETGRNYAKVQSIIEDESRVSAMDVGTKDTCVVRGNSESAMRDGMVDVTYISKDAEIKEGDELVTSHISSRYLPGLKIGTISDISMDSSNLTKSAKVTPVVDFQHIEEVLVITDLKTVPENSESAD